jgi:hypothetical protein
MTLLFDINIIVASRSSPIRKLYSKNNFCTARSLFAHPFVAKLRGAYARRGKSPANIYVVTDALFIYSDKQAIIDE